MCEKYLDVPVLEEIMTNNFKSAYLKSMSSKCCVVLVWRVNLQITCHV